MFHRGRMTWGVLALVAAAGAAWAAQDGPTDPAPTTHVQFRSLCLSPETKIERISTFCLDSDGNLLVCDLARSEIKVVDPEDKLVATWKPGFPPESIHLAADGTVYVGGFGKLARLDKSGRVLLTVEAEKGGFPRAKAAALATMGDDLFVSFGTGRSTRAKATIVRFTLDFKRPVEIAAGLRGCCQRLDMVARGGVLYVAENGAHRMVKYDRTGAVLGRWGRRDRTGVEGFGSCCNPMNLCFGPEGELYTSESGLGRVKRYTPEGEFLGLVGYADTARFTRAGRLAASCSNIPAFPNADATCVYVMDLEEDVVHVLAKTAKAE